MSATGGCLCGAVRYEADGPSSHPTLCHCESCRRASGASPVAWVTFGRDRFRFTKGEPSSYASSPEVTRRFCPTCGTALTYERSDLPDETDVTVATLDDPTSASPADHTWYGERLPWTDDTPRLRKYTGPRSDGDVV